MINTSEISLGQLVISKVGRDSGRKFIVLSITDELYVNLVDGDLRKVEKPKKKKVKHLAATLKHSQYISDKLSKSEKITNTMVRLEIEKLDGKTFQE